MSFSFKNFKWVHTLPMALSVGIIGFAACDDPDEVVDENAEVVDADELTVESLDAKDANAQTHAPGPDARTAEPDATGSRHGGGGWRKDDDHGWRHDGGWRHDDDHGWRHDGGWRHDDDHGWRHDGGWRKDDDHGWRHDGGWRHDDGHGWRD